MSTPLPEQITADHRYVWMAALNLGLYDADPGPREVAVGGPGERRVVDRRERLIDAYARKVLVRLDADVDRLVAVIVEARRKHADRIARGFPRNKIEAELVAIELAETAARIVRESCAVQDPKARQRLLAAARHQSSRDAGELFFGDAGALAADPGELAAELDRIDRGD